MEVPSRVFSMFERNMAKKRGQKKGEVFSSSGEWYVRYYVDGAIDETTQKPKRERVTVRLCPSKGTTKREAQRLAWDRHLSTLDAAHIRPSSAKTLLEFINLRFRPDVIETMKPTGKAFYESILRRHVVPILGPLSLREINVAYVQNVLNLKRQQGLSTQTVVHVRNCISAILRHARAMGWFFGELPTTAVRLPEMVREQRHALTWAQVCALSAALPEPCATLVLFLTLTGLRIGEAMGLRWSRVNLTAEPVIRGAEILPAYSIAVRESYVMGKYQSLKPSAAGARNVPIPLWFAPRLAVLFGSGNPLNPVFANSTGSVPIDQHNLAARTLKPAAAALGWGTPAVKKTKTAKAKPAQSWVSWHVFRHSYATLTDQLGLTMSERMSLLGHTTPSVTMQYTHPAFSRIREKLEGLPKLIQ